MASDYGQDSFTKLEKRALDLLTRGATADAIKMMGDPTSEADTQESEFRVLERIRAGEDLLRSLGLVPPARNGQPSASPRTGLMLLRHPSSRRVTLVFNGNTSVFSLPPPLVTGTDTHIVMLRDPTRCFGFLGIPELGEDYETCIANLRRIVAALGADELYLVGMSAGGSTAVKVGCDMQAKGVLGFSVPTTLDLKDDEGAELRHYPQLTKLYTRARHLGIDLAEYYRNSSPRPGLALVYSADHQRDSWLAERMRSIPGVQLIDVEGFAGHATYRWMLERGNLGPLIDRLFKLEPVSPPV